MRLVRKLLLILLAPIFVILLYIIAIDVGFIRIGTHPATIKHILANSGVYNTVVPGLLDQSKQITGGGENVSLNNSTIRTAAVDTFTPQFVQQNTEATIAGIYDWLNGMTPLPDFQIDLTSAKTTFASNAAQLVQQQLSSLPACSASVSADNFDPLSATCLPKGISAASAASTLQTSILGGQGFLDNPIITATSIKSGNSNQSVFADQLKSAPNRYRQVKKTPLVLGIITVLVGLAIILLSSTRRAGLRRVGWPLLAIGIVLLVFAWAVNRVTAHTLAPKISVNNAVLQSSLRTLLVDVEQAVDKSYWWFGGGYVVLGTAAIGSSMFIGRGNQKRQLAAAAESNLPPASPAEYTATTPRTTATPKPHRTIKIQ